MESNSVPVNRSTTSFSSHEKKKFGDTYPKESPEVQAQIRSQCVFCNIHGRKLHEVRSFKCEITTNRLNEFMLSKIFIPMPNIIF